jgi:hypothetical protein
MRRFCMAAMAGAVALTAGGCAPLISATSFNFQPSCSPMQASAYKTTSIMQTRNRVAQIQARYSLSHSATSYGVVSKSLVSGECR